MVEWSIVLALIVFGLALIVAEIIFVPGTTLVGVAGFVFIVLGVVMSFRYFGSMTGWATGVGAVVFSVAIILYCFKSNAWSRFSLKSTMESKVNEGLLTDLAVGLEGTTVSALRPIGKAELKNKLYEVKTFGDYLESGKRIRIINIVSNQIIVESIK